MRRGQAQTREGRDGVNCDKNRLLRKVANEPEFNSLELSGTRQGPDPSREHNWLLWIIQVVKT